MVWLNVVALSSMTALHDIPDSVFRNDGLWRQWYDAEAPETANVPDYEDRLSKFERMCVVKVGTIGDCLRPLSLHEVWLPLPMFALFCIRIYVLFDKLQTTCHHEFGVCLVCHRHNKARLRLISFRSCSSLVSLAGFQRGPHTHCSCRLHCRCAGSAVCRVCAPQHGACLG